MASSTIREFLVSLGFVTDEPALKKFTDGVNKATKTVFALAAAINTTAGAIAAGIARWASNLEALYFAAQRTGSSANQLKALDLAARNLGANAGEAQEAVEGLASALRTNPGNIGLLTGLLAKLGYTLKVNADGSIDSADALLKLSQVFKGMPFFQANQFAQMLGMSEHTLYQLTRGNLMAEYQKALKELGPNWDQASRRAHDFMVDLRGFEGELEKFGLQVYDALQQKLGFSLKDLKHWFEINGPWLAGRVADVARQMIDAAIWIAEHITIVVNKLREWDTETDGLSTKLIAFAVLLKVSGAGSIVGGLLSLTATLVGISGAAVAAAAAIGSVVTAIYSLNQARQGKDADNWLSELVDSGVQSLTGGASGGLGQWFYDVSHQSGGARPFLRDRGWSDAAITGILANLKAESSFQSSAASGSHYGIAQWDLSRQLDFKRVFGHDIHGSSADEQLSFVDWELRNHPEYGASMLRAAQNSDAAARIFSRYYERPGNNAYEENRRAAIAAGINQQNTFHISTNDPRAAAESIDARLKQINADLARSFAALTG